MELGPLTISGTWENEFPCFNDCNFTINSGEVIFSEFEGYKEILWLDIPGSGCQIQDMIRVNASSGDYEVIELQSACTFAPATPVSISDTVLDGINGDDYFFDIEYYLPRFPGNPRFP
jgi:hypothetical protein